MPESKVAVIAGYGAGISAAFVNILGGKGYKLALLARTQSRLDDAVAGLGKQGITAKGYAADLSDPTAVKAVIGKIHGDLGPISLLHWNAYAYPHGSPGFLDAPTDDFQKGFAVFVTGLVAAVQAAHADLKLTKGSILVTGGGGAMESDDNAQMAVDYNMISLFVPKAAQRKLVHTLHKAFQPDGIYVAEVTVAGMVKGTGFDPEGKSDLTPEAIAQKFWDLESKRDPSVWFVMIEPGNVRIAI